MPQTPQGTRTRPGDPALAFSMHDHDRCMGTVIGHAETVCRERGLRLTPVRRRVLEILLESHKALGAYDVLDRLGADGFGRQPPVAYRALDFLVEHGFAHRIQRLNAFAACMHPHHAHEAVFLICRACNALAEAPGMRLRAALDAAALPAGFTVESASIEAIGLCAACRPDRAPGTEGDT
jgi:Fur family zinc uptake transcriptional regulator